MSVCWLKLFSCTFHDLQLNQYKCIYICACPYFMTCDYISVNVFTFDACPYSVHSRSFAAVSTAKVLDSLPHLESYWVCGNVPTSSNHTGCVAMLPHLEPYWVCGHSPIFIYQQTLNGWCGHSLWPSLLSRTLVVPTSNLKLSEKHEIVDSTETWNHETIWPESDTEHETAKVPGLWKNETTWIAWNRETM